MSYDVHIKVVHHPKHAEDENVLRTGFKMADPTVNPLYVVAGCLRAYADELEEDAAREDAAAEADQKRARAREAWLERRETKPR